jgi:hypothetical protein
MINKEETIPAPPPHPPFPVKKVQGEGIVVIYQSCAWCGEINDITIARNQGQPSYCSECGHRADVVQADCNCWKCSAGNQP